jgi:hypothetical protein
MPQPGSVAMVASSRKVPSSNHSTRSAISSSRASWLTRSAGITDGGRRFKPCTATSDLKPQAGSKEGTTSSCYGACASAWPPYTTTGAPQAGSGASAALLATMTRTDGKTEVTYHGHLLYYYAADSKPGDTNGQGVEAFGAEWYVLSAAGDKVEKEGS